MFICFVIHLHKAATFRAVGLKQRYKAQRLVAVGLVECNAFGKTVVEKEIVTVLST